MASGLRDYGVVLASPAARAFWLAGFVARLPLSMTGIGTVLMVSSATGSFGRAGLITATNTLFGAISAPLWGRAIDRVGQAMVLTVAAVLNFGGLALLILAVESHWPLPGALAAAGLVGLGYSSAGSCVRARWSHRLHSQRLLNTAFALEAVLDELIFILGPVLVTFLATAIHPALGVAASATIGLVGALLLAAQRRSQPPVHPRHADAGSTWRLPLSTLVAIAVAGSALGTVFGGMEVVVVAYANRRGVLGSAGLILMAWSFGSLVAGLVAGTVHPRMAPVWRFRWGALALAASLVPLPFIGGPVLLGGLLMLSGMAIAPTLIAAVAVTQSVVPKNRLAEALGWNSTGLAAGVSLGSAVIGRLVDAEGVTGGFLGVVGAGVVLGVVSLLVKIKPPLPPDAETREPEIGDAAVNPAVPNPPPAEPEDPDDAAAVAAEEAALDNAAHFRIRGTHSGADQD